jgi:hypothetical protein
MPFTVGIADDEGSPIYGVKLPAGYRQWKMVAVQLRQVGREATSIPANEVSGRSAAPAISQETRNVADQPA